MSDTPEYDGDEFNNILRNIIQEPDEILHDNQIGYNELLVIFKNENLK
jgi:hypothetical protein